MGFELSVRDGLLGTLRSRTDGCTEEGPTGQIVQGLNSDQAVSLRILLISPLAERGVILRGPLACKSEVSVPRRVRPKVMFGTGGNHGDRGEGGLLVVSAAPLPL